MRKKVIFLLRLFIGLFLSLEEKFSYVDIYCLVSFNLANVIISDFISLYCLSVLTNPKE